MKKAIYNAFTVCVIVFLGVATAIGVYRMITTSFTGDKCDKQIGSLTIYELQDCVAKSGDK